MPHPWLSPHSQAHSVVTVDLDIYNYSHFSMMRNRSHLVCFVPLIALRLCDENFIRYAIADGISGEIERFHVVKHWMDKKGASYVAKIQ